MKSCIISNEVLSHGYPRRNIGCRSCRICAREQATISNERRKKFWAERNKAVAI